MSLGVNTNISSLTAQRALSTADRELATSMERLSTGKRINTASDDSAGMAVATRLTSQINGLNQAVKNANSAIALTQTIDGALDEVTDMLQRARELAVQSSSSTVSASDRAFIQEEVTQLMAEIDRIASSTKYNGQNVLDGTFSGDIQIGANSGESLAISVKNSSASALGNYAIVGDVIKEQASSANLVNVTDAADDIVINGTAAATIDVATGDSAQQVAAKINAVTATTGVSAEAKTQAHVYTDMVASQTFTLKINGTATASFSMSSTDVSAGVTAINNIAATTGVTATATDTNRILLTSATGADMRVENESALTTLNAKNLKFDGTEITQVATHAVKSDTALLAASTDHKFVNNSTGVETAFTTASGDDVAPEFETTINTALSAVAGTSAIRETTDTAAVLGAGDYYLSHTSTGQAYKITVATATVAGWQSAVTSAKYEGGSFHGETRNLSNTSDGFGKLINVYNANTAAGTQAGSGKVGIQGARHFGDFEIFSDAALTINIANNAASKTGIEATGVGVYAFDDAIGTTTVGTELQALLDYSGAGQDVTGLTGVPTGSEGTGRVALVVKNTDVAADSLTAIQFTVVGTDRSGNDISETVDATLGSALALAQNASGIEAEMATVLEFATVTAVNDITLTGSESGAGKMEFSIGYLDKSDAQMAYVGSRTTGDFDITTGGASVMDTGGSTVTVTGSLDSSATAFAATTVSGNDTLSFQGGIQLTSTDSFSVTQSSTEGGTAATNDNYMTSATAALSSVSAVSLSTSASALSALSTIDGAIEQVASIRSSLGSIENRLEHTVDNLMNVSENSQAARASIVDADFSVESANLAKAQVLLQAGTAMLAQANAAPQMVLQLLQ